MIPFNYLGWAFKLFGKGIYPEWVFLALSNIVQDLKEEDFVLDIGAGTGILVEEAKRLNKNPTYIAIDPAIGMLRFVPENIVKIVARAEALPFKKESFSVITVGEAIHHIKDLDNAFKEMNRVLKPGGYLFVFDFDPEEKKGKMIYIFERLFGEPGNFFSPDELKEHLKKYGFESQFIKKDYRYVLIAKKINLSSLE